MSLADTAAALLVKFGEEVTITSLPTAPGFDPITGAPSTGGPAPGPGPGPGGDGETVEVAYGYPAGYKAGEVDGQAIMAGDIKLILEVTATEPQVGGKALVDGSTYRIMDLKRIRRSGVNTIYICQLRAN